MISVDTEEDNWKPTRTSLSVENVRQVPRFQRFLEDRGFRPTYFVAYEVAKQRWAASVLLEVAQRQSAEVAAHLHPWNTPPIIMPLDGHNTMTKNLPASLQFEKLESLTSHHTRVFGAHPTSFRAGRFGIGTQLIGPLIGLGYKVDSSVTPYWDWRVPDSGPCFRDAPTTTYRLGANSNRVTVPDPTGPLVEVPVSCGFSRRDFEFWSGFHDLLQAAPFRALKAPALAWRSHLIRKVFLSPELHEPQDMLVLSRRLLERGVPYLHMTLHSPSLQAGLTPFTPSQADVERLYDKIDRYLSELSKFVTPVPALVQDFALAPGP